ncbi:MAG: hypothetical protein AB1899_17030 [Pseudomonadota bacterium]
MIEPVHLADFFTVFFSAAMVILFGALYALLFAFSRVGQRPGLMPLAYLSYLGLAAAALILARAANLHGPFWTPVVGLMLAGYLAAPHFIFRLCVDTHLVEDADESSLFPTRQGG